MTRAFLVSWQLFCLHIVKVFRVINAKENMMDLSGCQLFSFVELIENLDVIKNIFVSHFTRNLFG